MKEQDFLACSRQQSRPSLLIDVPILGKQSLRVDRAGRCCQILSGQSTMLATPTIRFQPRSGRISSIYYPANIQSGRILLRYPAGKLKAGQLLILKLVTLSIKVSSEHPSSPITIQSNLFVIVRPYSHFEK